jgi:ATP synthase protein I
MSQPSRDPSGRRLSPLSVGLQWATTITTIGLEMALPALGGWWLDRRFGTEPIWTVILALLGVTVAMRHLWDIAKRLNRQSAVPSDPSSGDRKKTP